MRHLSALDALFLQLETPETPTHVGSLMLLDPPKGRARKDPYAAIRAHLASRIHLAPVFWHKLAFLPGDIASPAWLRADDVDLDYHIRRIRLPKPGTPAQLDAAVAKLHEAMLDRDRPLWQVVVIEGLAGGQVGYYSKVHHAALDGQGGIAVAQAILDVSARPRAVSRGQVPISLAGSPRASRKSEPVPLKPNRLPPTAAKLLGSALRHTVAQYGRILKGLPETVTSIVRGAAVALTSGELRKRGLATGPHTPMNNAIGPERVFATVQIPLAEAKAIARHYDGKLNDAVLAICAGALRRHYAGNRKALAKAMIAAVPVSLRAPGDTSAANDVTMMLVAIATHEPDLRKRMAAIVAASSRAKRLTGSLRGAIPTDLPSLGLPWLMARITPLYRSAVAADRIPVIANLAISNVPGPQMALYLAGMKMSAYYPVSIVTHGLGLNVTIVSYDGSLDFGLVAAKSAMPDLRRFARHLEAAHKELLKTTRVRAADLG